MALTDKFREAFTSGLRKANPDASDGQLIHVQKELERRILTEPAPSIALVGEAGVGKSTTINSLFNAGLPVSDTRACTKRDIKLTIDLGSAQGSAPRHLIIYDMPGLGESIQADRENLKVYERILPTVDVFVWILDAQYRAIRSVQERLANDIDVRIPGAIGKLVVALNKVDLVAPGPDDWNPRFNIPSERQQQNIDGRESDVREKIGEVIRGWQKRTVAYSAIKRYRLSALFRAMLEAVPETRRWLLGDRMDLASYEELIDQNVLKAVRNDGLRFNLRQGTYRKIGEWEKP